MGPAASRCRMLLRSSLHRPLVARRLPAPLFKRNVVRSVPPDPEPQVAQPVVEESPSEATQPPLAEEPLASSSRPGSELKERIRQWTDKSAIVVRTRADEFTSSTKSTLSQLGLHLNKMTGYEEIEALKRQVVEQGVYVVFGIRLITYLFCTL